MDIILEGVEAMVTIMTQSRDCNGLNILVGIQETVYGFLKTASCSILSQIVEGMYESDLILI